MIKRILFGVFCLVGLAVFPAFAAEPAPSGTSGLSAEQKKILKDIETYFNGIRTIKSGFTQTSTTGAFAEGEFLLLKPGKMRLEYKPPMPVEVVSDGYYLIFHDKNLEQVTYLDIDSNPASIILKENFSFDKSNLTVTDVRKTPGFIEVSLYKTEEPATGRITLIFKDRPLELKQWQITDAQQVRTLVSLNQAEFNTALKPEMFKFTDPRRAGRPGDVPVRRH